MVSLFWSSLVTIRVAVIRDRREFEASELGPVNVFEGFKKLQESHLAPTEFNNYSTFTLSWRDRKHGAIKVM